MQLEQMRQDVMAMASHDLRNPLAVISMRAQLLESRQTYDEAAVRVIREQARRITRLLDDLGDVLRLEIGHIVLRRETLDLRMLASEAVERIQVQTAHHAILVELPEGPVTGSWDRDRLAEVLDNMLGNAVKYSPAGGEIVIRVEVTHAEARLSVADQGVGIPAEALPGIFERFHRAGDTRLPGLGLGLYIVRMLVEAHRGRVEAESVPGQGSTFTLHLPLMLAA
jgi:signal transduction histidine kinase